MRGPLCALGAFMAIAVAIPALAGDVYVVENSEGKKPIVVKKDGFALAAVPMMEEGKPNQGFSYTTAFELDGTGIQIALGRVDPKGTIAVHETLNQYILYVIGGSGQLTLVGKSGELVGDINYKLGDIIVFQPHTLHGWVNGNEPFEFIGVDFPVPRK